MAPLQYKYSSLFQITSFIRKLQSSRVRSLILGSIRKNYRQYREIAYVDLIISLSFLKSLKHLSIECCPDSRSIKAIASLTQLKSLDFISPYINIPHEDFLCIFQLTNLEKLSLYKASQLVYPRIANELTKLEKLKVLDLRYTEISSSSISNIVPYLKQLKKLDLSYCNYSLNAYVNFACFPLSLQQLSLKNNSSLNEKSLSEITVLKNLEVLDLSGVDNTNNEILLLITSHLKKLHTLKIPKYGKWNANGLKNINLLERLRILKVPSGGFEPPYVNNETLKSLGELKELNTLILMSNSVTNEGLTYLNRLKLKRLSLKRCKNVSNIFHIIQKLSETLEYVDISYSGVVYGIISGTVDIDSDFIEPLKSFQKLIEIEIGRESSLPKEVVNKMKMVKKVKITCQVSKKKKVINPINASKIKMNC